MADSELIAYSIASFVCALFVLEFGADKFIDHTVVVARLTGIPQTLIALLTAGAEWEELAVVVISIAQNRSSLAVGNIVGSAISNILGAFSLGLLFHAKSEAVLFDRSSKLYSLLLLALTAVIAGVLSFARNVMWRVLGSITIGIFAVYVISITWAMRRGFVAEPELSDSDESEDSDGDDLERERSSARRKLLRHPRGYGSFEATQLDGSSGEPDAPDHMILPTGANGSADTVEQEYAVETPIRTVSATSPASSASGRKDRSVAYHVAMLLVGFVALLLSAYVLSHSATTLIAQTGLSDVLFGVIILSIATTIPEKFIAVVSGSRGHAGIMVANTAGSNIFLLTLCMGILWTSTGGDFNAGSVNAAEIAVMLGSTTWMTATIWFGAKWARYIGAAMLAAYIAFVVLEFTVIR